MKSSTITLLSALVLGLATSDLAAQDAIAGAPVQDSLPTAVVAAEMTAPTLLVARAPLGVTIEAPVQDASSGGIKETLFGTPQRTSRSMFIGGIGIGLLGIGVVKGDVGAAMGVAGLLGVVGGLYFAFY